ncbi:helix-turn-helix transcriptional regulator [Streptomyces sp. C11-1]|uniref:Helix-turn-helix transcriptional regulator n=1 Tax=Streptomyces durocortorensis TaxID=2811104 RepID=A0ABY9W422_9ACTN|nr:helix-turn-helix transcriptional regulator [Streptomyces durocortorensis]WNF30904.1 helix-turn-helix transcriptional regulator [Streptomyces durocortorensis]
MARERSGRTAQHLVLVARLRHLREGAGLSVPQAARQLGWHPTTLRRLEQAQTSLDVGQVSALLGLYGAGAAEAEDIMGRLNAANMPGWWHPWRDAMDPWLMDLMSVESAASVVRTWDPALVPLLLRTPAYAMAVDAALRPELDAGARQRRADLLAERQKRLREQQARVWAVLPVTALRCRVGGPEVMREQLNALQRAAGRREVTVQLHPDGAPPHPLTGVPALSLYRVEIREIADHVVREGGLPGTAEVWDTNPSVQEYQAMLDMSCVMAIRPARTREILQDEYDREWA